MHRSFSVLHIGSTEISGADSRYSKNRKNLGKGVDICRSIWYSNKAVAEVKAAAGCRKEVEKPRKKQLTNSEGYVILPKLLLSKTDREFKNFWKKFLTNEMKFAIIAMFRRIRRVPCKLNNVTKWKHQTETSLSACNQSCGRVAGSQFSWKQQL